jgi:hypothetical protein
VLYEDLYYDEHEAIRLGHTAIKKKQEPNLPEQCRPQSAAVLEAAHIFGP